MITDLIFLLEVTDLDDLDLSEKQLYQLGIYLIHHLRDDHQIPGNDYYQIIGICDWYRQNGFMTEKQQIWMYYSLKNYISQRDFTLELM